MNIEETVKANLFARGFDGKTLRNNNGLIGATIDETILAVVKSLRMTDVAGQSERLCKCQSVDEITEVENWCRHCEKRRRCLAITSELS